MSYPKKGRSVCMPAADKPYISIKEAACLLDLCPDTVWCMVRRGEIAARKTGRIWRIPQPVLRRQFGL